MKLLLAVNNDDLESYINSIQEINVCGSVKTGRNLLEECKKEQPDVVMIYHDLPQSDMQDIIIKLTSKNYNLRIVYLYGEDDKERAEFINFLISRGVYDYCVGDLTVPIVEQLLFHPKSREDIKKDIIDKATPVFVVEGDAAVETNSNANKKDVRIIEKEKTIYKPFTLKQKVISFIGPNGSGKTSLAINTALGLAEGLKETVDTNIIILDWDFNKPDIAYHLDTVDSERCFDAMIPKIKSRELQTVDLVNYLTIPFKHLPNLKLLTGTLDYSDNYRNLDQDDYVFLLNTIKNNYDIILFDTDGIIDNPWTRFAYNNSHIQMLVMELNIAMIEHQKKLALKMLNNKEINYDPQKYYIVANKYFQAKELDIRDILSCLDMEKNLCFKVSADVRLFTDSINKIVPVLLDTDEKSLPIRKSINDICSKIHPINVEIKTKRRLFSNLLKRKLK